MHNMTPLSEFLKSLPHGGRRKFAKAIGCSVVHLSQLAERRDGREPSPKLAVRIEIESGFVVRRQDLRSDWAEQWPELAGEVSGLHAAQCAPVQVAAVSPMGVPATPSAGGVHAA